MNPRVIKVEPLEEYKLKLHFTNNEIKIFDTNPYLNKGIFKELKDLNKFKKFKIEFDTLSWENGLDLAPEFLYDLLKSDKVK